MPLVRTGKAAKAMTLESEDLPERNTINSTSDREVCFFVPAIIRHAMKEPLNVPVKRFFVMRKCKI